MLKEDWILSSKQDTYTTFSKVKRIVEEDAESIRGGK